MSPTVQLRWLRKDLGGGTYELVLQQLHTEIASISPATETEPQDVVLTETWVDVPIVNE